MNIFQMIGNLFGKKEKRPVSHKMESALDVWIDMYESGNGTPEEKRSLELPAGISSEFARLSLAESSVKINEENERAKFLSTQFQNFWNQFTQKAEMAFALGSMALKPYISGGRICVDLVRADRYVPMAFDDTGNVTAAVFMSRKMIGKRYYTRLESHTWDADTHRYTVENRAYMSLSDGALGSQCDLSAVDGWDKLQPYQEIANVDRPLFAVFRVPSANRIDMDSAAGCSVYANAVDLINEANRIWGEILWEYEGTELAIDASMDLFDFSKKDKDRSRLKRGIHRLFRKYDFGETSDISKLMQTFSPAIRDQSLFNGLNHILQRIEFSVGLAYGTISEPQDIEKTAEEIRSSKQRSYVHISAMQKSLEDALNHLLYAMDVYTTLYDLAPDGEVSLTCNWGDSVLEDTDKEFQRRLQLFQAGALKAEYLVSYAMGCDPDKAAEYIPEKQDDGGLFSGGGF